MTFDVPRLLQWTGCILAGAIISTLIAWSAWHPTYRRFERFAHGNAQAKWPCRVPSAWPPLYLSRCRDVGQDHWARSVKTEYSSTRPGLPTVYRVQVVEVGFPFTAMRSTTVHTMDPFVLLRQDEFTISERFVVLIGGDRLPYRPAFPGFAANSILFGSLLFAIISMPARIRRTTRRRRGLCPACGYDLRGSVARICPECGAARPNPPARAPSLPSSSPSSGGPAQPGHSA